MTSVLDASDKQIAGNNLVLKFDVNISLDSTNYLRTKPTRNILFPQKYLP